MKTKRIELDQISLAIEDIRCGKPVIVVDDENRENEGDFVVAAEKITTEIVNFLAKEGRGLICAPLTASRCEELELPMMVSNNSDPFKTAFTVSVDLLGDGVTTGISAEDRAKTIKALVNPKTNPQDLTKPGHIFPLIAKDGGVLRRTGHTEAAIDLARLAGLSPAGVIVEIMNDDGSMARLPELREIADKLDLKLISIEDLVAHRMQHDRLIKKIDSYPIETSFGKFSLHIYEQTNTAQIHFALSKGQWSSEETILTRVHPYRSNQNILNTLLEREDEYLIKALKKLELSEKGAILFIHQEKNESHFLQQLLNLKSNSGKSPESKSRKVKMDHKDFGIGAQMLHELNIKSLNLLTNSEGINRVGLNGYGLRIEQYTSF